jgi:hypothetical protein
LPQRTKWRGLILPDTPAGRLEFVTDLLSMNPPLHWHKPLVWFKKDREALRRLLEAPWPKPKKAKP